MTNSAPFDASDNLHDEETIAEYLTAALEDPNPDAFLAQTPARPGHPAL